MAFRRGNGTVQVELANVQSFCERISEELDGVDGNPGIIDEHKEMMMREANTKEASELKTKRLVALCALFSAINPICKLIEYLHSIWK